MLDFAAMVSGGGYQYLPLAYYGSEQSISIDGAQATIIESDLRQLADARIGYQQQLASARIETLGSTGTALRGSGDVTGTTVGGSNVRIARIQDPADTTKYCWRMRAASSDPDTASAGAKRAEFVYGTFVGYNKVLTCGFNFRLPTYTGHTDEFLIAQVHAGSESALINPWLAFYLKNNSLRVSVRFNNAIVGEQPIVHTADVWRRAVVVSKWHETVGYVACYIDGALVLLYTGPVAEPAATHTSYWKSGIYQWTNAGNVWDGAYPVKEVLMKGLYLSEGDTHESMDALLTVM